MRENVVFSPAYVRTVTMCVHLSSSCNLRCKYCFSDHKGDNLTIDEIKRFIDIVTVLYPHADRYIVDMSGSGEPLLRLADIVTIADYCKTLSDRFVREFLPTFVTNGTLLDKQTVKRLQDAGVIFGVSIDGTRAIHDKNRVFCDGRGSYDTVMRNVENIEHREYLGAAVTYGDGDLLTTFESVVGLFPTVSMKPMRYIDKSIDSDRVCKEYDKLVEFLYSAHVKNDTPYIFSLLRGDDYFGKFLKRVVLGVAVYGRCDAGIGRFALCSDRKIYCCPAGLGKPECEMGDLDTGIRLSRVEKMWRSQINEVCCDCRARFVCGGECKIVSHNKYGRLDGIDPVMCRIKRHLYDLAVIYRDRLKAEAPELYGELVDEIKKTESYYLPDNDLIAAVTLSHGAYTFTELKAIKDSSPDEFYRIFNALHKNSCELCS